MPAPASPRLADVISGPITISVPWTIVGGDDEGIAATGVATYTLNYVAGQTATYSALCDDLDRMVANGTGSVV